METIDERAAARWAGFAIGIIFLVGMAVGLGVLLSLALHGAIGADEPTKKLLARLAWISVALLGLTLLMLFWLVAHYLTNKFRTQGHPPTEYVDAWRLAGQRARAEPQDEDEIEDDGERPPK